MITWLLPEQLLVAQTPSMCHGTWTLAQERKARWDGCKLIQESGQRLQCTQIVIATAQAFLHRFYYYEPIQVHSVETVAMGCIFLSAKYMESPKPLNAILVVFHAMQYVNSSTPIPRDSSHPPSVLPMYSDEWQLQRNMLLEIENKLLQTFGFHLNVVLPHQYLPAIAKVITSNEEDGRALVQKAWAICNDGGRIDLCVRYEPFQLACGAIDYGSRLLKIPLPTSPSPWWHLFDTPTDTLTDIVNAYNKIYHSSTEFR